MDYINDKFIYIVLLKYIAKKKKKTKQILKNEITHILIFKMGNYLNIYWAKFFE